ncbi:MAG TPA: Ig-like domain-containing protein [Thermoanaerobaculia bacterium]|nr:Ig-like domain-containing protein [Thermoanaerobaculia bacterium]
MKRSLLFFLLLLLLPLALHAQAVPKLDENCVVTVLNRVARVSASGSWVLPNIPTNSGMVRARATCQKDGVTYFGQSNFFVVPPLGVIDKVTIHFDAPKPVPGKLSFDAPAATILQVGATLQLTAKVTYADNSVADVTLPAAGTNYVISNPAVATISDSGFVTALAPGAIVVTATNEGTLALLRLTVSGSSDSDGDGMPDQWELDNGFDPENPADAALDADSDGLTNAAEYGQGTNPRQVDSDGDGVTDGVEVQTGTNPIDPASFDLGRALSSIAVTPANVVMMTTPIATEVTRQLQVTGTLLDGRSIDLTQAVRGTTYSSADLAIVSFASGDGILLAGNSGRTTVTVRNNGFTATTTVNVNALTRIAVASIPLDNTATGVALAGDTAYVTTVLGKLHVIDIAKRGAPVVKTVFTVGTNARDVTVRNGIAYIAAGTAGVVVVDVSNPAAPALVTTFDTPGEANDLYLSGNYLYVADRMGGLRVISVANPAAPQAAGNLALPFAAMSVAVSGNTATVVSGGKLYTVDVQNPAVPLQLGNVAVPNAEEVEIDGNFAYVAAYTSGFTIVDITQPAVPIPGASIANQFYPHDLAIQGGYAFFADELFANAIPVVDVSTPATPQYRAALNLTAFGDPNGYAIEADAYYAYLGAGAQFLIAQHSIENDENGIAPFVRITSPAAGSLLVSGAQQRVTLEISDDVGVAIVSATMNGQTLTAIANPPYSTNFTVPGVRTTIMARATDFAGNETVVQETFDVSSGDPGTNITGRVLTKTLDPAAGAVVTLYNTWPARTATVAADGTFTILNAPTTLGDLRIEAKYRFGTQEVFVVAPNLPPVAGGTTVYPDLILPGGLQIAISSAMAGQTVIAGQTVPIHIEASNDNNGWGIGWIYLFANDEQVQLISSGNLPYNGTYLVPNGVTSLSLRARASDSVTDGYLDSTTINFNVIPDPLTTVVGRVLRDDGTPVAGATVTSTPHGGALLTTGGGVAAEAIGGLSTLTDANGVFRFDGAPTTDVYELYATYTAGEITYLGAAPAVTPVRAGTTTIPDILLGPGPKVTLAPSIPLGTTLVHNEPFSFTINGSADPGETLTEIYGYVNGEQRWWFGDSSSLPYTFDTTIPADVNTYVLEIVATDSRGNKARATLSYDVIPDPGSTLTGTVNAADGTPVAGALVTARRTLGDNVLGWEGQFLGPLGPVEATTDAQGNYTLTGVSTIVGDVIVEATKASASGGLTGESAVVHPVRSGTVPVPAITLAEPGAVKAQIPVDTFSNWTEIHGQKLAIGNGGAVHFMDLVNPVRPKLRGSLVLADWQWVNVIKFTADGNRALILMDDPKLVIADVSNLDAPTVLGEMELEGYGWPLSAAIDGSILAVASDDLILVDISNPAAPVEVGRLTPARDINYIALSGHTVIATDGESVSVIDITDPSNPVLRSRTVVTQRLDGVVTEGTRAYLTGGTELAMLDFSDPVNPVLTANATPLAPFETWVVAKAGNRVFVGGDPGPAEGRIEIVNISTPAAPTHTGSISDVTMAPYRPGWLSATDQYLAVTGWYRHDDPRAHPEAGSMIYIVRIPEPTP